jgi:methylase of polypeptide subunit release factors
LGAGVRTSALRATRLVTDLVIHAWDLARATTQDETLDPEVVQLCVSWFSRVAHQARQPGIVGHH